MVSLILFYTRSYKTKSDCPLSIKLKFSPYIDKIANSAKYKIDNTSFKKLKWTGGYTVCANFFSLIEVM